MVTRPFGRVIACWHGADSPRDAEWDAMLDVMRASDLRVVRCFVLTSGGAPTSAQRKRVMDVVGIRPMLIAVVSEQVGVRFVASLLAMMTRKIRSFTPAEIDRAYAHLELRPEELRQAQRFVEEFGLPGRKRSFTRPSLQR